MRQPDYLPLCSIAGWDPTCGAGAGADLRVFSAHGAHGSAVISSLTAQSAEGVRALQPVPAALLRSQIEAVQAAQAPRAWKIGLLPDAPTIQAVSEALAPIDAPVILDPVLAPTAGGWSLDEEGLAALRAMLPGMALVTPNAAEAIRLAGHADEDDARDAGRALLDLGAAAVLVTGADAEDARDWLLRGDADDASFALPRVAGGPFHGTGCALSSAIAVRLAQGHPLDESIARAKQYVHALLALAAQTQAWLLPHLAVRPA